MAKTPSLNLGKMCEKNYKILSDYYDYCVDLQSAHPEENIDPWYLTALNWVGKVRERGVWDYKVKKGPWNKEYNCTYGGNNNQIRTAEFIGNYNYGYTGSFLFSLDTLHFGSYAVSGFNPRDVDDWPAIDEGYYDA